MLQKLRRFGELYSNFPEWVRAFPKIHSRSGREAIMRDLLLVSEEDSALREEMVVYAKKILTVHEVHGDEKKKADEKALSEDASKNPQDTHLEEESPKRPSRFFHDEEL